MKIFKTWVFTWWEVGMLKVCLVSFGIILGLSFPEYLIRLKLLWWILFIGLALYFILRFFKDDSVKTL